MNDRKSEANAIRAMAREGRIPRQHDYEPPKLPDDLAALINAGEWPRGHFPSQALVSPPGFLGGALIDLYSLKLEPPPIVSNIGVLISYASTPRLSLQNMVVFGSKSESPVELPWLDVEKALCIGEGSDFGDELSILLDFRTDPPRVIANHATSHKPLCFEWCVIADTWQDFLQRLTRPGQP